MASKKSGPPASKKKAALTTEEKVIAECAKWETPALYLENVADDVDREIARAILASTGVVVPKRKKKAAKVTTPRTPEQLAKLQAYLADSPHAVKFTPAPEKNLQGTQPAGSNVVKAKPAAASNTDGDVSPASPPPAQPPADSLPGNDEPDELPDDDSDLSLAAERRMALKVHKDARIKATGGKPPEWVDVYFNEWDGQFIYKKKGELHYVKTAEKNIVRDLKRFGLSEKWKPAATREGEVGAWTELEWPCANAFAHRSVYYAGPIPGYQCPKRGELMRDMAGRRLLVTEQAAGVWTPEELTVDPEFYKELFAALLGNQANHFFYMMAAWLETLLAGAFTPGPVLWLIGKKDYGKSLGVLGIQQAFGGRMADPSSALLTKEPKFFTGHLLSGEIWTMDDPFLSPRADDRERLAAKLKMFFHSRHFTFEDKGQKSISLNCWRRGVNAINDHRKDLQGMPTMREGVTDKQCIYRCEDARASWQRFFMQRGLNLEGGENSERLDQMAMANQLKVEAPQFRAWLRKNFRDIPPRYRDSRYIVKPIQNPELMTELHSYSPEMSFLNYACLCLFKFEAMEADEGPSSYEGFEYRDKYHDGWKKEPVNYPYVVVRSADLEAVLSASRHARQVEHQLRGTGNILSELAANNPEKVQVATMQNGANRWRINNPFFQSTTTNKNTEAKE